jgi:hypothetical protein
MRVELWGRFSAVEVKPRYWRALCYRTGTDAKCWLGGAAPPHLAYVKRDQGDQQQAMLVDVVELVDLPERALTGGLERQVMSVVRLNFFERSEDLRVCDFGDESDGKQHAFLVEGRLTDGELRVFPRFVRAVEDDELPCQVVERRPEVEQDLAYLQAPLGIHLGHVVRRQDVLTGLRIAVQLKSVDVRIDPRVNRVLQVGKMTLRPLQLEVYAAEVDRHTPERTKGAGGYARLAFAYKTLVVVVP